MSPSTGQRNGRCSAPSPPPAKRRRVNNMNADYGSNQLSSVMAGTGNFATGHGHHTRSQGLPPYSEMDPLFVAHHRDLGKNGENALSSPLKLEFYQQAPSRIEMGLLTPVSHSRRPCAEVDH